MKTMRKLFVSLLAIAMLFALSACSLIPGFGPTEPADDGFTVTFYNNGEVYKTVEVAEGESLTMPKAPKGEKGKGLVGWSTIDGDAEEIIDPATLVIEADLNLYAVWADVYTVVINPDNGVPFTVLEVFAGTVIEQPADPVKEGFKFVEWRDALNEATYDFTQPIYADLTLKAMYGDGSPNRVSDTKWDFTLGHGAWIGGQGGWNRVDNGVAATDMVYTTTEDGYASWGFTKTDSLENIPVINGENAEGYGMKFIFNEGISVEASKAKLVVAYMKPKYFPMDNFANNEDQFRISILTSKGGMIYGYGTGSDAWSLRTDAGSKTLIQVDHMEDGWIRVQFKIHELDVWSEDAILKSMSISFVQRKSTPVMDIVSFKSIELLDQEEFIDPHKIDYVTNNKWDMTKEEESKDWYGVMQTGSNTSSVTTVIDANGTSYKYGHSNAWRAAMLNAAKIDISKCSGIFSATIDVSGANVTQYRVYIVTDAGGHATVNSNEDKACYYSSTSPTDLVDGWTVTPNADGTVTVSYDLTKLEYWKNGTELKAFTFVTVDSTTDGTVVYKSISLVDTVKTHNCETDGHKWVDATCTTAKTCSVCGATEGEAGGGHVWNDATCTTAKTCSACGATEGEALGHTWVDATCTSRVTCSACNATKGTRLEHNYVEGVCSGCGLALVTEFTQNSWDMTNADHAAAWAGYHAKKKNESLTSAVTEAGFAVTYTGAGNGWKGIVLENAAIDISKLSGKLIFTYSSDLAITSYRIHILTDRGGNLTSNGTADCYVSVSISDIDAGTATAWTRTVNDDGSVTVTFDMNSMAYFKDGTVFKGLSIVTVTANKVTGTVTHKSIELEEKPVEIWDMKNAEDSADWYATQDKDNRKTGSITVTENGSVADYGHTNGWKGMLLRDQEIDITKLDGVLSFTYSTELTIGSLRIYVVTESGGSLTHNDEATAGTNKVNFYKEIKVADIASSESWTSTVNEDGTTTVTFDLTTIPFFANDTTLKGLTIVTVASGLGSVTYTEIAIH